MALTEEEFDDLAKAPEKIVTDEGAVEERPLKDLKEADQYSAQKAASGVPWGMKIARTKPGGTVV